jgi:hypothetical protein
MSSVPSGIKGKPKCIRVPIEQATSAILRGSHTTKELTDEKNRWLGGLLNTWEETSNGFGQNTLHHCYRTFAMRQVQEVAALVYRDGKTRLNAKVLDQLGPVGFAWMFADDGFKHTRRDRYDEPVLIATCGFPQEDREEACAWFCEKFGYTSLTLNGSLSLSIAATEKFVRMIAPYLLPAARYKLPKNKDWPEFVGFPERKVVPLAVEIESIEEYDPPMDTTAHRGNAETRWCLQTTEGNFLTGFGFVKNSGSYDRTVVRHQWTQMARNIVDTIHDSPECLAEALSLFPDIYEKQEYPKGAVDPWPNLDTILLHRLVASELPHRLGFVGSFYTDAPSWKCFDANTEILTPDGWVLFKNLSKQALVAQWDNGAVSFVQPRAYVDQEYSGKVWKLESQAVDLLVTPDHKMVYHAKGSEKIRACRVQDLSPSDYLPHVGVLASGCDIDAAYVQLIAAFQADGSWALGEGGKRCFDFGFTRERKIVRLREILDTLGIAYRETQTGTVNPRTRIWVTPCPVVEDIWLLLGQEKHFGPWLLSWSLAMRRLFLDELSFWDGTKGEEHTNYNSTEEENADWVQACAVISGRPARKHQYPNGEHKSIFRVSLPAGGRSRDWSRLEKAIKGEVDYTGRIYCVSVPSGFIVVRRNGKVTISGNTDREGRKLAYDAESDPQLHEYCSLDTSQTFTIMPQLWDAVYAKDQQELIVNDHEIQELCVHMHEVGMFVDQPKRAKFEQKKVLELVKYKEQLQSFSGLPLLNPGSIHQLRKLLFKDWKLQPVLDDKLKYTLAGDPSTSDDAIRACLAIPRLREEQKGFLKAIRNYRSVQKELGTYIAKLRPRSESIEGIGWDVDALIDENSIAAEGKKSFIELSDELFADKEYGRKGITWEDGRMRPGYNASVAVTGRLSSSKPINAQNFPKHMRSIIRAQPGHILVGADADQLELRIAAARWKCPLYLNAFEADADPHSMTAIACFGDQFINADGWPEGDKIYTGGLWVPRNGAKFKSGSQAEKFRKLAKIVQYLSQYGGSPEAGLNALQQTEDENGELIYLLFQLRQYRMMHEAWLKGAKEFPIGWQHELAFFRKHGYSQEHVMGRKRDHLNGEDMNEIVNFGVQGGASSLMNRAMRKIQNEIPLHKWGHGTGIITMTHDALVVECPDDGVELVEIKGKKVYVAKPGSTAAWVSEVIEDAMNQTDPSLPGVKFTAAADIAMTWDKVG